MSRVRASGLFLAVFLGVTSVALGDAAPVAGIVKHLQVPIPGALVFVYGVTDARLNRARTQPDGSFQVEGVPAGVYDVIAYKTGFYPSLLRLWHQGTPTVSTIAIDLVPSQPATRSNTDVDIWSWRDRLPADVLREITSESPEFYRSASVEGIRLARVLNGDFSSSANVAGAGGGFSRSEANLFGSLPDALQYSLHGSYATMTNDRDPSPLATGNAKDAVLLIGGSPESAVSLSYAGREFTSLDGNATHLDREAVRFEHQSEGSGRMELSVSRRSEDGFERVTSVIPDRLPSATQAEELRGRWSRESDDSRAGVTIQVYRRQISEGVEHLDTSSGSLLDAGVSAAAEHSVVGPISVGARLNARAGSTGSVVAPGGILRVQLGSEASLVVSGSRHVSSSAPTALAASAPRVVSGEDWQSAASSDASAALTIGNAHDGMVQIGASASGIGEPLRVYFDGDLLLDVGNIYLFDGNRLEKLTGSASGHLSDLFDAAVRAETGRISGRLATDSRDGFALTASDGNYYAGSASLTVRPTKTDVSCAVRRIRQILQGDSARAENFSEMLRLSVGQDLTVLGFEPFGSAWRVILSYETDSTPLVADQSVEETALLRHRVMGGLSVSF